MIARRPRRFISFTRRDAARLFIAAAVLIGGMTAILSFDIFPTAFRAVQGAISDRDVLAPRSLTYVSTIATEQARDQARGQVPPQYDYTTQKGDDAAQRQSAAFDAAMNPVDAAFAAVLTDDARRLALAQALPTLSAGATATLQALSPVEWNALRTEMARVLETAQRQEVRDSDVAQAQSALRADISDRFSSDQQALAAEIISPMLVANSTFDAVLTAQAKTDAAARVDPVRFSVIKGQIVVKQGEVIDDLLFERLNQLDLLDPHPDVAKLGGWFLLSVLVVGSLLGWVWRFRPEFWHRSNALVLLGLVLLLTTLALRVTADRSVLPYFVPTAAAVLLLAVLLDSSVALVVAALLAIVASAITGLAELGAYVFLAGLAGLVVVRRGERLGHFVQAGLAMAVVNVLVVSTFTLLGDRDITGVIQLWGASLAAAGGSAVAAVGSFAVLGNLFGITTSFQLLELANPSQPLLRRLLLETPGTYHHSLMVGNLAERAAEAIGADPLITRVAAYYHDIGKLGNPHAFIENQTGMDNLHDDLTPEQSAAILAAHVANGIDLAYQYKLPKPLISFIPQHHGTALMSYFYAKAKDEQVAAAGAGPGTAAADEAAQTVDERRFRHAGPKPQSREAAILMLADSVEASVRSLTSHDEPAIRGMVDRIIAERQADGQFDECDLTLRDLDLIREAFVAQLLGMYHRRIEYPQNKIVELESRRAASGGRGA
ncbi:MAG: cyclic-di-AMP phosphodiesterase PgpH [Chloroflexota bacterium]|nr:cyclic-di-AMP phosphodiesterase PgpH [Chloroflexota bacterium]